MGRPKGIYGKNNVTDNILAYRRDYYKKHKDIILQRSLKYYQDNKDKKEKL